MADAASFDPTPSIAALARHAGVFRSLLAGRTAAEQSFRRAPGAWNLLEIACHLFDEERDDFRTRVRHCLEGAEGQPPAIDPAGWVEQRAYAQQNYDEKLEALLDERSRSLDWLGSQPAPQWDRGFDHPRLGHMTAKLFLVNWVAHDLLHIRQIVRVTYEFHRQSRGEDLSYAGDW